MKWIQWAAVCAASIGAAVAQAPTGQQIAARLTANDLKADVSFLASDALEGRGTPSRGLDLAAEFIAAQFRRAVAVLTDIMVNAVKYRVGALLAVEQVRGAEVLEGGRLLFLKNGALPWSAVVRKEMPKVLFVISYNMAEQRHMIHTVSVSTENFDARADLPEAWAGLRDADLAAVTGVGGGTFRDLILGVPVFWIGNRDYVLICTLVALVVFFGAHRVESRYKLLLWLDAIGLAVFAVMGAAKGMAITGSPAVSIVMGMLTACFGGMNLSRPARRSRRRPRHRRRSAAPGRRPTATTNRRTGAGRWPRRDAARAGRGRR